ncbi:MAG TPA: thioredoxin domain-containing protein [Marisediminicola sp.]|jgi:protein-disulfide isomerase|nr:disulfide bond formation protein DsbA [Cryobacterium sp.]HEV7956792.1 thioredoxin domain-containing protein [Marisediminicola sp.]
MRTSTKWNLGALGALVLAAIAIVLVTSGPSSPRGQEGPDGTVPAVAANSHRLSVAGDGAVTFVEFLDFECEVCAAAYPLIEDLREEYAGRVTFVLRYFPLPGHKNSMTSAIAVEAAAQQGQLEAMYQRMFETQAEWGEQQDSKSHLFRTFAVELGLDLEAYDRAVADPATEARVRSDFDAGRALGVQGTPTFFLNDKKLDVSTFDDLREALDRAVSS